jgi:hypothetical protein
VAYLLKQLDAVSLLAFPGDHCHLGGWSKLTLVQELTVWVPNRFDSYGI